MTDAEKTQKVAEVRAMLTPTEVPMVNDADIHRFLVARSWNVAKAYDQLHGWTEWRRAKKLDQRPLMGEGIPFLASVRGYKTVPDVDVDMNDPRHSPYFAKMYKCMGGLSFHKFDKDGLPLVIERVGLYDSRRLAHICTLDALLELHTDLQEYLFRKLMPEASDRKGTLVDKQCVIFDCTGMGLHQFYMPAMGLLRAVADNDAKYYPERLGRLFLVNSPPVFQKIWVMIKRWLDKGILEKVHILGSDYKEVLLKYIDADNLPEYLGGSCTCSHSAIGCVPRNPPDLTTEVDTFSESASLKDSSQPHTYEVNVPMEELVLTSSSKLNYRFKSSKKPVQFEIRYRKWGKDEEVPVVTRSVVDSHMTVIRGSINAEPGVYTLIWTKSQAKGLAGLSLVGSVSIEYEAEVIFEEMPASNADGNVASVQGGVEKIGVSKAEEEDDDDEFVDAD